MRVRFSKSGELFNKPGRHPEASIREIFLTFDVKDFHDEIIFWLERSLTNDRAAYQEAKDREDVMDFCYELVNLVQAFYLLSLKVKEHKKPNPAHRKATQIPGTNKLKTLLPDADYMEAPRVTITRFCEMFPISYAEHEMLDLLDAVITYEGVKQVRKENLVLFYQCIHYLVTSAYILKNKK